MTLLHLGDRPELQQATLDRACHIAAGMSARPFDITLDRVASLSNPRPKQPFALVASRDNASLLSFQRELMKTMKNAGLVHAVAVYTACDVGLGIRIGPRNAA
jgi:2'-5' RNA ligase